MAKKPTYLKENRKKLIDFCKNNGYEIHEINEYQYRVLGATHIIDIWPSRMKYHRIGGESMDSVEYYYKMESQFNEDQVRELLLGGKYNAK